MEYINMDKRFIISKILIGNFIFLLLFATTVNRNSSNAEAFSHDSANSCSPNGKPTRRGRAQLLAAIPCDLSNEPYCSLPGSAYPWHAVRRFVHENQGLMKRMYGDMRHIAVLRNEMENNEIDVDDINTAAERYSREGTRRASKFMHQREDFVGNAYKTNDVLMEPHFRPVSTTAATPKTATTTAVGGSNISTSTSTTPATTATTTALNKVKLEATTERTKVSEAGARPTASNALRRGQYNGYRGGLNRRRTTTSTTSTTAPPKVLKVTLNATGAPEKLENFSPKDRETDFAVENIRESDHLPSDLELIENVEIALLDEETNLEVNSVYAPTTATHIQTPTATATQPLIGSGDNIQIIESPQFGTDGGNVGLHNVSLVPTISTVLKLSTTIKSSRPQPQRQRPQQQQPQNKIAQSQQSQVKESPNSKLTTNESERMPSTSMVKGAVAGDSNVDSAGTATGSHTTTAETAAAVAAANNDNSYKINNNNNNKNDVDRYYLSNSNYNNAPTEATPVSAPPTHQGQLSAAVAAASTKTNLELLSGEKIRKPTATAATTTAAITSGSSTVAVTKAAPVLHDAQLYQDTLKQEPVAVANSKGVNACPVKEEVVAPFWANNTRGEVLALLNMYPFEQYVHWEKCTHEHKQMYCRDGCRCEQQYRLHRLLAYDPHNECRGIFSDWFRFPSCCICRCYNIPMDFRATSRSPRADSGFSDSSEGQRQERHPIELAEEKVKRAIYEHAAEEWYRPRDEFDFF